MIGGDEGRNTTVMCNKLSAIVIATMMVSLWLLGVYADTHTPQSDQVRSSSSIVVFAPHPDDEALGAAGVIHKAVQDGLDVTVVVVTNGDGYQSSAEVHFAYHKNGSDHWYTVGEVSPDSTYPNGVVLSPGVYNEGGGGAGYLFTGIPNKDQITLSMKHHETGWGLHDVGIWARNQVTGDLDEIEETQVDGENIWRKEIDGGKYINTSGDVEILVGADAWDESDIAWVKIERDLDPTFPGTSTYYIGLGEAREDETRDAMASLGLDLGDIKFLGYPDGGLDSLWQENYNHNVGGIPVYRSDFTDAYESPYPDSESNKLYRKDSVLEDIGDILGSTNPDTVYVSHSEDTHGDHARTASFVLEAMAQEGLNADVYYYLIHYKKPPYGGCGQEWPLPSWDYFKKPSNDFGDPSLDLVPDDFFSNYVDEVDSESFDRFRDFKIHILQKYYSQRFENCEIVYYDSFAKNDEVFWKKPSFDPLTHGFSFSNPGHIPACVLPTLLEVITDVIANPSFATAPMELKPFIGSLEYGYLQEWNMQGHCEAMSMLARHYYLHPEDIPGGKTVYELQMGDVVLEICEAENQAAKDPGIVFKYASLYFGWTSIEHEVATIRESLDSDIPIVVLMKAPSEKNPLEGYHAVLAYDYEMGPGDMIRIKIYDSNFQGLQSILTVNTSAWSFVDYDKNVDYMTWFGWELTRFGAYNPMSTKDLIGRFSSDVVWIMAKSPVDLHAYDESGNHVGVDEFGNWIVDIPDTLYLGPDSDPELMTILHPSGRVIIEARGRDVGEFTLEIIEIGHDSYTYVRYENVSITPTTTAVVEVNRPSPDYTMYVDGISRQPDEVRESGLAQLPIADAGADQTVYEGDIVSFDASGTYVPQGATVVEHAWDFDGDGIADRTGSKTTFTWYDNIVATVTLTVTYEITYESVDEDGNPVIETYVGTSTDTMVVTVLNVEPTASIDRAYMHVDFTLRGAGEKWHNIYWTLYEKDWESDGGRIIESNEMAHLEIERYPGDPDRQSDTVYDVYVDMEKIYCFTATYNPYEDDNPISGQLWGSNPIWIILTFEDGSTERIHHNFNVQQSLVRDSELWVHVEPWCVDLSPWFVGHIVTFESSTFDPGTDDETFTWDWGDATSPQDWLFTYRPSGATDPYPSPYDKEEGVYPVDLTKKFYHIYGEEGDFIVTLTIHDDDNGINEDTLDIDAIHTDHICPTR